MLYQRIKINAREANSVVLFKQIRLENISVSLFPAHNILTILTVLNVSSKSITTGCLLMLTRTEYRGVKGLLVNLIIIIFQSSSQSAATSHHYSIGSL